jgi:hypothetical protein
MPDQASSAPSETPTVGHIEFYGGLVYLAAYLADPKRERIRLQISGEFSLTAPDGTKLILNTEHSWAGVAALLSLQYLPIEALEIDREVVHLRIGGWSLVVGPEDWDLEGPWHELTDRDAD